VACVSVIGEDWNGGDCRRVLWGGAGDLQQKQKKNISGGRTVCKKVKGNKPIIQRVRKKNRNPERKKTGIFLW